MFSNAEEVLAYIRDEDVKFVDVRFCDLPGTMQHFNVPAQSLDADFFTDGQMFDGSSIRGFQAIHESDMKLVPDVSTAYVDPFRTQKTLNINFHIVDPYTDEPYSRDPRQVAAKAEAYLRSTGIADTAFFAPEAEFYIFDDVRDLICLELDALGLQVERSHHEVGTGGQAEINYRFDELGKSADKVMLFKYVVKNVAHQAGRTATFMPKPLFGDNGSGMHVHQSLWKNGQPLFFDEKGYGGLSDTARWYIGGLLHHAPSLLAFTNPTVNSYHRLVPGFEAPVNLVYSQRN